jgi:adenylyl- and sulfurtransferase ThiI
MDLVLVRYGEIGTKSREDCRRMLRIELYPVVSVYVRQDIESETARKDLASAGSNPIYDHRGLDH